MKRDLLFVAERLAVAMDERRLAVLFRLHGIGKTRGTVDAPAKLLASFLRKADEGMLGRVLVEVAVFQAAHSPYESAQTLHEAAKLYKVDVAAITAKVGQEFTAKEKARAAKKISPKPSAKTQGKAVKKAAA
ncbi:hypothetical protein ACOBR2_11480 [Telmatobacter bradus]|uniref:hypothetical protein n=1 Tax=Telmatobacter bradus TaxID=474953 RepID=UPI003B4380E2